MGSEAEAASGGELVRIYMLLGPRARSVLTRIARRLELGKQRYNADLDDSRDWLREAGDEALDLIVYAFRELGVQDETPADLSEDPFAPTDEVDCGQSPEQPPMYVPVAGDFVRIAEIAFGDSNPIHAVGDLVELCVGLGGQPRRRACGTPDPDGSWLFVGVGATKWIHGCNRQLGLAALGGTYCRVELVCHADGTTADGKAWIPAPGDRVRVVAAEPMQPGDSPNNHAIGDALTVAYADRSVSSDPAWVYVHGGDSGDSWCRVVPAL